MVEPPLSPVAGGAYDVHTGTVHTGKVHTGKPGGCEIPTSALLGLEPPRFCAQCGRRMIVQVRPDGWWAQCSRHGRVDSTDLEAHR
ncbi:MAG: hypothetical protein KDB50_12120 [Mycobacterium sp.]|nr:hypothetical protein [Mycobacterium sp.]